MIWCLTMSGENHTSRAPILRMEDVLELDAIITPDPSDVLQKTMEAEDSETDDDDDRFDFANPRTSHVAKTNRFAKKRKKRKRLIRESSNSLEGYDSFLSEEDLSEIEGAGLDKRASLASANRQGSGASELTASEGGSAQGAHAKSKPRECGLCNREKIRRNKRKELRRSNSQYKSCDSDVSNNDSAQNWYLQSSSDTRTSRRKSVERKLCNCYSRDFGANKYNRNHYTKKRSQDHLDVLHSR